MDFIYNIMFQARKSFLEQVTRVLPTEEPSLPESIVMLAGPEPMATSVATRLTTYHRLFQPLNAPEVKAVLVALFNKIQKQ